MEVPKKPTGGKFKIKFQLDLIIILIVLACAMLAFWKPWSGKTASDRTIEVTGDATVKAVPNEFVFYPNYQFTNADKNTALAAVTAKSNEVTAKLKSLGVKDKDIKVDSSGYDPGLYQPEGTSKDAIYSLQMTITVDNKDLAQKAQDYLVTTSPTGSVTPQPTFSESQQKVLESKGRDLATKDARAKAEQTAKNLDFKVGKVKSVSEASNSWVTPMAARDSAVTMNLKAEQSLTVQPGENELPYSITVVYYIK